MLRLPEVIRRHPIHSTFAAVSLLLAITVVWLTQLEVAARRQRPASDEAPARDQAQAVIAANEGATANASANAVAAANQEQPNELPPWPASLRDSAPDGSVTLDAAGRVRASMELRRLFDYFLSAIGEIDLAAIRSLLLQHVRGLHGEGIAAEVAALFDRYVESQQALAAMHAPPSESLRERLERVRDLRRRLLGSDTADAFFGDEERYAEYTLDRQDTLADRTLTEEARQQELDTIDARLSPEQRALMQETNAAVLVDEQNRQFEALSMDPEQRHDERAALFGSEAAARLAAADAEQAAWDARVASYVQARDAIRADTSMDAARRERALADLRLRSFDEPERRRVASLEAIRQL